MKNVKSRFSMKGKCLFSCLFLALLSFRCFHLFHIGVHNDISGLAKSWPREAEAAVIELKTRFFFENKPKMTETSTEDVFLPSKAKLESQPQALAERAERTELRPRAAATLQRKLAHPNTTRGRCTGQISRL